MAMFTEPLAAETGRWVAPALARLRNADDPGSDLMPVLDIAIGMTGADMGTLQRFDERTTVSNSSPAADFRNSP